MLTRRGLGLGLLVLAGSWPASVMMAATAWGGAGGDGGPYGDLVLVLVVEQLQVECLVEGGLDAFGELAEVPGQERRASRSSAWSSRAGMAWAALSAGSGDRPSICRIWLRWATSIRASSLIRAVRWVARWAAASASLAGSWAVSRARRSGPNTRCAKNRVAGGSLTGVLAWAGSQGGHPLAGGRAAPSLPLWPGMAPLLRVPAQAMWLKNRPPRPAP